MPLNKVAKEKPPAFSEDSELDQFLGGSGAPPPPRKR
jgi:hypothetical protein